MNLTLRFWREKSASFTSSREALTMQLRNTSTQANLKTLSEAIFRHSYAVPHVIHDVLESGAEKDVMLALFKLQDDFLYKSRGHWSWFFVTTADLVRISKRAKSTVKRARQQLMRRGLIEYRLGEWRRRRATEYRILIDQFYLADRMLTEGSADAHTKTMAINEGNQQQAKTKDN